MAAFCSCCGAEITNIKERCDACGTPMHGMTPPTAKEDSHRPPETASGRDTSKNSERY